MAAAWWLPACGGGGGPHCGVGAVGGAGGDMIGGTGRDAVGGSGRDALIGGVALSGVIEIQTADDDWPRRHALLSSSFSLHCASSMIAPGHTVSVAFLKYYF